MDMRIPPLRIKIMLESNPLKSIMSVRGLAVRPISVLTCMDFRGFDSSIMLNVRGGILMSTGDFPESLSQAMLVGIMLVGRLGVPVSVKKSLRHTASTVAR